MLAARRASLVMARPCREVQHRGQRFTCRPQEALEIIHNGVAALEKGPTISCGLRLVLNHLVRSDSIEHGADGVLSPLKPG